MVYCSPEHRFGSDALLLARFCEPKRAQKAADLCSGCGIVALEWHDRGHRGPAWGWSSSPRAALCFPLRCRSRTSGTLSLSVPTCALSGRAREVLTCVRAIRPISRMDQSQNAAHALARHENTCTLDDVCQCAFRLLRDGGRFALCHRPERLAEVLAVLRANRLEPKRLAFVKNKADARHGSSLWKRRRTARPACGWSRMC